MTPLVGRSPEGFSLLRGRAPAFRARRKHPFRREESTA